MPTPRFVPQNVSPESLRDKALLALEDAVQECRYRTPRRSFAVRFALAYLWACGGCRDRRPFDDFWQALGRPLTPWSFSVADTSLLRVYRVLGIERPDEVQSAMWRRWSKEEGKGGA